MGFVRKQELYKDERLKNYKNIVKQLMKRQRQVNDLPRLLSGIVLRIEADHKPSSVFDDH